MKGTSALEPKRGRPLVELKRFKKTSQRDDDSELLVPGRAHGSQKWRSRRNVLHEVIVRVIIEIRKRKTSNNSWWGRRHHKSWSDDIVSMIPTIFCMASVALSDDIDPWSSANKAELMPACSAYFKKLVSGMKNKKLNSHVI